MNNFKFKGTAPFFSVKKINKKKGAVPLIFCLFVFSCLTSGCEPLRKKFTRQKKKDSKEEVVPILDPITYIKKQETTDSLYRHHYSLCKIWQKDFIAILEARGSDKKAVYNLNKMILHLEEMRKLLKGEKQKQLQNHIQQLQNIVVEFDKPAVLRNNYSLKQKVSAIGKDLRKKFGVKEVQDSLVK